MKEFSFVVVVVAAVEESGMRAGGQKMSRTKFVCNNFSFQLSPNMCELLHLKASIGYDLCDDV